MLFMKLSLLLDEIVQTALPDCDVTDVCSDTRKIQKGSLFVCIKGANFDGHEHAAQALEQGACAVVCDHPLGTGKEIVVPNTRLAYARLCAAFCGNPERNMRFVGVTGTNGKTTTTNPIKSILTRAGHKVGLVGTIQNEIGDEVVTAHRTTPDAYELYHLFRRMADAGCDTVVMEVSSHSLALHGVDGTHFDLALFTNLSLDHLDFHKTMEAYLEAKMLLFKRSRLGLSNIDDEAGRRVYDAGYCRMLSYAIDREADYKAENIRMDIHGVEYDLVYKENEEQKTLHIAYPYPGRFNVYNTMAAAAAALVAGVSPDIIVSELGRKDRIVRGRFQTVHGPNQVAAVVDYSHAPDALLNVLETIEEFRTHRIITVFGCGGDRDRSKRPVMGKIAGEHSDYVIATSDNPRTEDPYAILEEVEAGVRETNCPYEVIENRRAAIQRAAAIAEPGDIILIAGKGHEDYQIIGREKIHFDDVEEIEKAFAGGTI